MADDPPPFSAKKEQHPPPISPEASPSRLTFVNKCDELERPIVAEFDQRCFDRSRRNRR
jgi:hypothetical protein